MQTMPQPGTVVLYDNGWEHSNNGRPHIVVATCTTRGVRLCPLTSTPTTRRRSYELPLPEGSGNLRRDSWVAAVDANGSRNQLIWVDPMHLGRSIGRLTESELTAAKLTAITQVKRWKARTKKPVLV